MTGRPAYEDPAVLAKAAAIILNARTAGATNADRLKTEPGMARSTDATPRREVRRAA
jgi:hypothetical protein